MNDWRVETLYPEWGPSELCRTIRADPDFSIMDVRVGPVHTQVTVVHVPSGEEFKVWDQADFNKKRERYRCVSR
jgi:hypothetical protein